MDDYRCLEIKLSANTQFAAKGDKEIIMEKLPISRIFYASSIIKTLALPNKFL